jgi:hypothetical protein
VAPVVHPFNITRLTERMRRGEVLFIQRAGAVGRMRAVSHLAKMTYIPEPGDCLVRGGNKYPVDRPPLPVAEDVPLPVPVQSGLTLCFGDRIRRKRDGSLLNPLNCVVWPILYTGDTVLVMPQDGDWCPRRGAPPPLPRRAAV